MFNAVEDGIMKFISEVSTRHNIDPGDLVAIWTGDTENKFKEPQQSNELDKLKVKELQALCKNKGIKSSGTKKELIERLDEADNMKKEQINAETNKKVVVEQPVFKKVTPKSLTVAIRRNQWGNHEHPETCLVFDKNTKKVIGKQNDNGSIDDLIQSDIDLCNKYKFEYNIPENLDKKSSLDDVHVEELEDDEIIESDNNDDDDVIDDEDLLEEEEEEEDVDFDDDEYEQDIEE